jgi:hypothetical protein
VGRQKLGVARPYGGTLGKLANCQVAVYLAYASGQGHTLLDTRLYLPEEWADDAGRLGDRGKTVNYFHPRLIELQKEFARALLGRTNPHTKTRYADEPTRSPAYVQQTLFRDLEPPRGCPGFITAG